MRNKGIKSHVAFLATIIVCLLSLIWFSTAPAWASSLTNVTDSLSDYTAGVTTTHSVTLKTANSLPDDGQIVITFPAGFDLSKISLGSNPNSFTSSVSGQTVTLQKIVGASTPAHTTITVPLYSVGNSAVPGSYRVSVKTVDPTHFGGPQTIDGPTNSAYFTIVAPSLITVMPSVTISDKTYDKTAAAVISGRSLSGIVGSQDVSLAGGTASFSSVNAGNSITVNITGLSLSGADAAKYVLSSTSTIASASIAAIPLTVTAAADSRVYDGSTGSTVAPVITSGTLASGDAGGFTQTFSSKNVGAGITLTPSGSVNDGNGGNNYAVSFVPVSGGTITARPITVTGVSDTKFYNGTVGSSLVPTITGGSLAAGDSAVWTQNFETADAGTNKSIIPSGSANDGNGGNNYTVSLVNATNGSITPKALTVSGITAANKVYDGNTSATLDVAGASMSGVISGDSVSLDASGAAGVFSDKKAGTNKTITISGMTLSGSDAGNYSLNSVTPTSAQITARPITVSAAANSKTYDGSTSSAGSPTITGGSLVSGDSASWSQTFSNKNAGTGKTLIPAGSVSDGNNGQNYNVSFVSASSGTITARPITVTAAASSKLYDGSTSSAGSPTITGGSLVAGDSAVWTQTFAAGGAGTNKVLIPAGSVNDGNSGNNYAVTLVNATTGVITKATPLINWAKPADITAGASLGIGQLNAAATGVGGLSLNGAFTYLPPAGTILPTGNNQTLRVDFIPADSTNYNSASASVMVNVGASTSGGGGGTGGGAVGGGSPPPANTVPTLPVGATNLSNFVDSAGVFKQETSARSGDSTCSLVIPGGTAAKTAGGGVLSYISIVTISVDQGTFAPSAGTSLIGSAYNLGPEGTTFMPPITISMLYDVTQLPVGATESQLAIVFWDAIGLKWIPLAGVVVDPVTHSVSAPVSHFSLYSLLLLPPARAAFSVSQLTVSPADLPVGQTATISVQVSNSGEESGDYEVSLEVAGNPVENKQISVTGQSVQTVIFNLTQSVPGTYEVVVNGLKGSIRILPLAPVSTPTNAPSVEVETPTSTSASGVTILSEPTATATRLIKVPISISNGPTPVAYLLILVGVFVLTLVATVVVVRIRRSKI
jgi:hypothetical protein